ncbi:GpE family phage tail protein [Salmonella enterica subsp. enterica]|nr:GpE family phage tail protein [Salmonella enterica subsp. enterica]
MTIDDLVADIATIFHWSPSITDVMPLTEVLAWRTSPPSFTGRHPSLTLCR